MRKKEYIPTPVDTSDVKLPDELLPLVEDMARNVHEVWARTRLEQGWRHGQQRDDNNRRHPDLVPYDELPEAEKIFDRNTSVETLKLILKLGFTITK
ncbi:MAG: Ryanodine receptor Ryr [Muribaculaceae bacterium]|nr:Ryanodine receptor Ryr [Muribaculaceae bacterium]